MKRLDSEGHDQEIKAYLNTSFVVVEDLDKLSEEDLCTYDFVIQYGDNQYRCYPITEAREILLKQKVKSLISLNESLKKELEVTRKKVKELTQILHSSYDEIFVTDANGDTLFVSEACKKLTGLPPEAFIIRTLMSWLKRLDRQFGYIKNDENESDPFSGANLSAWIDGIQHSEADF